MGTKIHCKTYLPGFYSMRDLNEDSSSSSWPFFNGDKTVQNGQYYNGFMPRTSVDGYPGHDKDALKQKMLEHEAVFKNQVFELHRLYRIQRDMMEEAKRKELHGHRMSMEPASSSSLHGSQMPQEDARKWHMAGFPLFNSGYSRTSIPGVEIVNSPLSCTKGNIKQTGLFPFQNGTTSKDSEALDSRPLKVRKKLFDLQLPADEYIDTEEGERLQDYKVSEVSSYAPNGHLNGGPESSMKLFVGGHAGMKTDCPINASASSSCLRRSTGLADLNEPVEAEETMAPSSVDFLGRTSENAETKSINHPTKLNAGYYGVTGETIRDRDGFLMSSSIGSKVHERGRLSHIYEGGFTKNNLSSLSQGRQPDKLPLPSHPVQCMPNQVHPPTAGIYPSGYSREDLWRDGLRHGLESSGRSQDQSNNSRLEHIASLTPGSHPFFSSSCFTGSRAHSVSSWAKPTSSSPQKVTTLETSWHSAAAMTRSLQPSAQIPVPFSGKWQVDAGSRLNPCLGRESTLNGFYQTCVSGSKELKVDSPSVGFDYLNGSRADNLASERSINHTFGSLPKSSHFADSKPAIDINLNEVLPQSLSNEVVVLQDLNTVDGKSKTEDNMSALPWLKAKPAHVNEVAKSCKNETARDLSQLFTPNGMLASSDSAIARKKEIAESRTVKKILGFPIFERGVPENDSSSLASTSVSVDCHTERKDVSTGRKNGIIDINVACEPDDQIAEESIGEKEKQEKGTCSREYIDLNSCVSDCEDPPAPCYEKKSTSVKITLEIDLEVPVILETEDDNTLYKENMPEEVSLQSLENKNDVIRDDVLRNAAETIVAISSSYPQIHKNDSASLPTEASLAESLLWFVNAVSSYANELENPSGKELRDIRVGSPHQDSSEEIDDFEAMTLQLAETKEEDYMPIPFVPEVQKMEDTGGSALPTRSRRGQARRGRQRRDFQRDILPGLASLSRHEVTEDLQIFGGLMRATGHSWNTGLTRRNGTRNGGARGRRRVVVETLPPVPSPVCAPPTQQLNNIGAGLEDRSLTGWGKTPRRPRRQRCPPGNPPTVALT
ncbi:uncharacterized protein LOC105156510 isoform X2 [Sesamum indicum]|nr:uncharacterized protein LOC105156510 isoform X2 [Sesamum indicum]XP_020547425.1 uncharacterized protein LOC105156510 isoform X2 [Sesamum indicum]